MKTVLGSINHHNLEEIEDRLREQRRSKPAGDEVLSLSLTPDLWGDFYNRSAKLKERLSYLQGLSRNLVVDGHFLFLPVEVIGNGSTWDFMQQPASMNHHEQPTPRNGALRNGGSVHIPVALPVAYFNILRQPASRVESQFYYEKFEGDKARKRASQGQNASDAEAAGKGIVDLGDACADSPECAQWLRQRCTRQLQHLCGSPTDPHCSALNNSRLRGALAQVSTRAEKNLPERYRGSRNFDVLGLTEHMVETLEMLECAFPRAFAGAAERYRLQPVHSKEGITRSFAAPPSPRTKALLEKYCADETELYDEAQWAFWARYKAMKASLNASKEDGRGDKGSRCCRQRHVRKGQET